MTKKKQKQESSKNPKLISNIFLAAYILILLVTFFKVYNNIFDDKINLGGDNAGYYILGNAIAQGEGYVNIHSIDKTPHNHFPPGYPLIIGIATKIFSNDIEFIKKVNGFFLFLSIGLLFYIFIKITESYHIAFITCLMLLVNYNLLEYSTIMMSEIPFLFFVTLGLWLLMKTDFNKPLHKNWIFLLLIICLSFTYHIRSTGIALFGGILLYLLIQKNWKYVLTLFGGYIALGLPWFIRSQNLGGNSYMKQLFQKNPYRPELGQIDLGGLFTRFWNNFERYTTREVPSGIFNYVNISDYKSAIETSEWVLGLITLAIVVYGLIKLKRFFKIIAFYLLAYFGIILLWPEVWFGVRFLIPIIPLITFLFVVGVVELLTLASQKLFNVKNESGIQIAIVVIGLFFMQGYGKKGTEVLKAKADRPYPASYENYFNLAKWVKTNTDENSVTCCRKGQLFYLYSNKYVTNYKYTLDQEDLIQDLEEKKVDYVVLDQLGYSSTGRYLFPAIKKYPAKFKQIHIEKEPDTYLFEFHPELGYTGEWQDDQRHGKGSFVWPSGLKFEGNWANHKREGDGTMYFPNGQRLEGTWENDQLNGEVIMKSKNDSIIERSLYRNNEKIRDLPLQ